MEQKNQPTTLGLWRKDETDAGCNPKCSENLDNTFFHGEAVGRNKTGGTALQAKISGYYLFTFTNSVLDSNHFYHNMKYDISVFGVVT